MKRAFQLPVMGVALYAMWLGMMAVHELGHALHARLSGGVVDRVSVPLAGFSLTTYSVNPRPGFVAWGGPIWGCVVPLVFLALLVRAPRLVRAAAQFFAGFCLVANGVYLGVGWTTGAGDAGELVQHGTPVWALIAFGILATGGGLLLWHLLGTRDRARRPMADAGREVSSADTVDC